MRGHNSSSESIEPRNPDDERDPNAADTEVEVSGSGKSGTFLLNKQDRSMH